MKNRLNKTIISLFCLSAGVAFSACSDWTETEGMTVVEPNIKEQNPGLYAQYLEDLRNYKNSHHKTIYAWFDNSQKTPTSKGEHLYALPDSIDVAILMYPDSLTAGEVEEMNTVRKEKGTKFIFTLDYEVIKANYDAMADAAKENADKNPVKVKDFTTYMVDTLQYSFGLVSKFNYDGISVKYNGKSRLHMDKYELLEYSSNETAYIGIVNMWIKTQKDKLIVFEGKPQNLIDKTILESCKHIIIETSAAMSGSSIAYSIQSAKTENVPDDRFIVTTITTSLDTADTKTGYWSDGSRSLLSSAGWAAVSYPDFTIAGLGIRNINNDYYNVVNTYEYSKRAINIMNPSLKSQ